MTHKERREVNRRIATEYVNAINAVTFCSHCGAQPIEWHGEHHPAKPNARISSLRTQGVSIKKIKAEMDICVPLCRICHMTEDGRLHSLIANQPVKRGEILTQPKPCSCCGKITKPTRNNMCSSCDNHHAGRRIRKKMTDCGCCVPPETAE